MPKKILITDDQADIRKLLLMTLEFENFEIKEASNGEECLVVADRFIPDIVLLDVMMPGNLDGYQVCQYIKANPKTAHTKVILLTARGQAADLEQGKQVQADKYVVKPFSPLELIDLLETM